MIEETLEINNKQYNVRIYTERRKTALCSIGKNINIRLPYFLLKKEKLLEIEKMKEWAKNYILKNPPKSQPTKEYNSGDIINLKEKTYTLVINTKESRYSKGRLKENNIIIELSNLLKENEKHKEISNLINRVIAKDNNFYLEKKIKELNTLYFNLPLGKIRFKNQKTRWGSCSHNRNINISTRLLLAPEEILDYVCIHELAHLKEHNHSPVFWKIIEVIDPNHKDKNKWLRKHGKDLII